MSLQDIINEKMAGHQPVAEEKPRAQAQPEPEAQDAPAEQPEGGFNPVIPDDIFETNEEPAEAPAEKNELDDVLASDEPPKEGKAWAHTKHLLKEKSEALAAAQSKIEELKNRVPEEQLLEYKKQIEALEEKVGKYDLSATSAFRKKYDQPLNHKLQRAQKVLMESEGVSETDAQSVVRRAAQMNPKDMNRYLMDEAPSVHAMLALMVREAQEIGLNRQEALEEWRATREAIKDSEERTQQVQSVQQLESTLGNVFTELTTIGNVFYKPSGKSDMHAKAWNDQIELRKQAVKRILLDRDPQDIARYVAEGFTARDARAHTQQLMQENAKLKEQLKGMSANRASTHSRGVPAVASKELEGKDFQGTLDTILSQYNK